MNKFSIDLEKLNELNGSKSVAFFNYIKNVTKNRTQVVLKGQKVDDYWLCDVYECATPTSKFFGIKLPAGQDPNKNGTPLIVALSTKLMPFILESGSTFMFDENRVTIKKGTLKMQEAYEISPSEIEESLEQFARTHDNQEPVTSSITIGNESDIFHFMENTSNLEAFFYIEGGKITYREDSFFFRTPVTESVEGNDKIFINVYTATKIGNILSYCEKVKLSLTERFTILQGYIGEEEIVKNISSVFEATEENPTDEDLASISPSAETNSQSITLETEEFFSCFGEYMRNMQSFMDLKKAVFHLYKNGEGLSVGLRNGDQGRIANFNIGTVEVEEPEEEAFSQWSVVIPLSTIKNIVDGLTTITLEFDDSDDTAVLIKSGDRTCLSGKLFG